MTLHLTTDEEVQVAWLQWHHRQQLQAAIARTAADEMTRMGRRGDMHRQDCQRYCAPCGWLFNRPADYEKHRREHRGPPQVTYDKRH